MRSCETTWTTGAFFFLLKKKTLHGAMQRFLIQMLRPVRLQTRSWEMSVTTSDLLRDLNTVLLHWNIRDLLTELSKGARQFPQPLALSPRSLSQNGLSQTLLITSVSHRPALFFTPSHMPNLHLGFIRLTGSVEIGLAGTLSPNGTNS